MAAMILRHPEPELPDRRRFLVSANGLAAAGVLAAVLLVIAMTSAASTRILNFTDPAVAPRFRVINDGVMGGVSRSRLALTDDALRFEGEVSLENNGGFASFRGPVSIPANATALLVTVRGDGKRYKLTLKMDDADAAPQYQAPFTAPDGWTTIRFVPADFAASFRGRPVQAPALVFGKVRAIGVLISDRQAGTFRLDLRELKLE
jgi:NADH dehydrogenase [ubiquinone] 1 alpha subcomplex assembly factor 1